MSIKQRPRLDKFFSRIKNLLVAGPRTPVSVRPVLARKAKDVQMEFDLGLKDQG